MLKRLNTMISGIRKDEDGATAIEYGLIAAGIAVAIIALVQALGGGVAGAFAAIVAGLL